jgi:hypothetical protein
LLVLAVALFVVQTVAFAVEPWKALVAAAAIVGVTAAHVVANESSIERWRGRASTGPSGRSESPGDGSKSVSSVASKR